MYPQYLSITHSNIEPSEEGSISDTLFAELFAPIDGQNLNTYLIVDANYRKKVIGRFDLDRTDLPIQSLFQGPKATELKEVAPYIVDVTLQDPQNLPKFHADFFRRHINAATGIFIRSPHSISEIRSHLRRFTRIRSDDDTWRLFRFWDPTVGNYLWRYIAKDPHKSAAFAGTPDATVHSILSILDGKLQKICFPPPLSGPLPVFVMSKNDKYLFRATREEVFHETMQDFLIKNRKKWVTQVGIENVPKYLENITQFLVQNQIYREPNLQKIILAQIDIGFGANLTDVQKLRLSQTNFDENERTQKFINSLLVQNEQVVLSFDDIMAPSKSV